MRMQIIPVGRLVATYLFEIIVFLVNFEIGTIGCILALLQHCRASNPISIITFQGLSVPIRLISNRLLHERVFKVSIVGRQQLFVENKPTLRKIFLFSSDKRDGWKDRSYRTWCFFAFTSLKTTYGIMCRLLFHMKYHLWRFWGMRCALKFKRKHQLNCMVKLYVVIFLFVSKSYRLLSFSFSILMHICVCLCGGFCL